MVLKHVIAQIDAEIAGLEQAKSLHAPNGRPLTLLAVRKGTPKKKGAARMPPKSAKRKRNLSP